MPMDPTALKSEVKASVVTALSAAGFNINHPDTNGEGDAYITAVAEGVAFAVVAHLQANALVNVNTGPGAGSTGVIT